MKSLSIPSWFQELFLIYCSDKQNLSPSDVFRPIGQIGRPVLLLFVIRTSHCCFLYSAGFIQEFLLFYTYCIFFLQNGLFFANVCLSGPFRVTKKMIQKMMEGGKG